MKELKTNLKFVWQYIKSSKKNAIIYVVTQIIAIIISIIVPIFTAKLIVYLTDNSLSQLIWMAILILGIESSRNMIRFISSRYGQKLYQHVIIHLQSDLGKNMLTLDNKTLDKNSSGTFIQRLSNDTDRIAGVYTRLTNITAGIIANIGVFLVIFFINKLVFLYVAVLFIILYIIQTIKTKKYNQDDKKYRQSSEAVSGFVSEMVRGARDIKMLNCEHSFLNTLYSRIRNQNKIRYNMLDTRRKYDLLFDMTIDIGDFILIVLMVFLISKNLLTVAYALVLWQYHWRVVYLSEGIGELLEVIKDFNLSASRVFEIISGSSFVKEEFGSIHLPKIKGDFEFKNVDFSYDSDSLEVLHNLSFKVSANETVAFVGKSGAGKSTIFSLLARMYDVNKGSITIDGIDIKNLDKDSIRGNITIISQNPYIFNLSIKDNFRLVKEDVTDKEIKKACKVACLSEFIESLPDKYDTIIGESGITLSGGQRQRLAIARALIQKTEIILFDEATSALDNETQTSIQEAIANMKGEYTILMIAHRLSTIINADRILFVEDGHIICEGTHKQLLKKCKSYKKLYETELKHGEVE